MHHRLNIPTIENTTSNYVTTVNTARWTSPAYDVQFGQIDIVTPNDMTEQTFRLSAWGLSLGLRLLLTEYSDQEIRQAISWLTIQQNAYVAMMLEQVMMSAEWTVGVPPLDHLFLSIDAELYLPRGLRMVVTCVTNIVTLSVDDAALDKFVAVLDPGEAHLYVQERRGMNLPDTIQVVH